MFDGEVGDATARVELVRCGDRLRRADVDAARAGAAVRARWLVDGQGQVGIDFAEEKPRSVVAIDQAGVLADPAQARVARERAFHHRRRVHEHAVPERADFGGDAVGEFLQAPAHELVVVATARVTRDIGAFAVADRAPVVGISAGRVVHAHRQHAQGAGP